MTLYYCNTNLLSLPTLMMNPLNAELNPNCHLLALLGAHYIFHVSGLSVKLFSQNFRKKKSSITFPLSSGFNSAEFYVNKFRCLGHQQFRLEIHLKTDLNAVRLFLLPKSGTYKH